MSKHVFRRRGYGIPFCIYCRKLEDTVPEDSECESTIARMEDIADAIRDFAKERRGE